MRLAWLLVCAACLGDPVRPVDGDGGPQADARRGVTTPFPPGTNIRVRPPVARLNGDVLDDLVLANSDETSGTGANHGLYIVYGRADGFLDGYDEFLPTLEADPVAVTVADFMDGPELDILVLGRRQTGEGRIIAFAGRPLGGFAPPIVRATTGFAPRGGSAAMPEPVFVTTARIRGSAKLDAVYGDLEDCFSLAPLAWTQDGLTGASPVPLNGPGGNWSTLNYVTAAPSAVSDRDDLLVVDNTAVYWYRHDPGQPIFEAGASFSWPHQDPGPRFARFVHLDGEGVPDVMSFRGEQLELLLVSRGGGADPTAASRSFSTIIDFGDQGVDDALFANLDADSRPELITLDEVSGFSTFGLRIHGNLRDTGSQVASGPEALILPEGHPRHLAVGDFDGDGTAEIWAFGLSMEQVLCYHAAPMAGDEFTITGCP